MKKLLILFCTTVLIWSCEKPFEIQYSNPDFLVGDWFGFSDHNNNLVGLSFAKEGSYVYQELLASDTSLLITRVGDWVVVFVERSDVHTVNFEYDNELLLTNEHGETLYNEFFYDNSNVNP